jgi:hypothetical protein
MVGRVPVATGDQRDPRIAVAPDDTAFVVWLTDCRGASNIGGRLYDATGSPLGTEFVVNAYTTGAQTYPDVGVDAAGSFLVVWGSNAPGTEHDGIFARLFDGAGTAAGDEFAISAGSGSYPVTDGGAAGEFVVAWHHSVPPDSAILARRFGPALQVGVGAKKLIVVDKVAVIKPGKLLKLVGKGLGDTAIDILGAGEPSTQPVGAVVTAYCVDNGADTICHCSAFPACSYQLMAADTGAKLVCKNGVADADCAALAGS